MHLKQLKLAGFKSFVDPTIIPLPSQLVAVVGPNGCGKSNIIDAVRWVLGESSAKNLRGEMMSDVIFNGSTERKAIGQASIEIVFDNSMGRLIGQFSSYQEIAIKRLVTRDGDSSYFLNGSRCRRRDITDIFLGTGATPKGYSIIGQGTVSRLIEAKPEELRAYLEEAAGISKYKERRRETLLRIEHTRENLDRVLDISTELSNQLQRLERQAKAAERYKTLREAERICRAEILALKWQNVQQELNEKQRALQDLSIDFEKHQQLSAEAYKNNTLLRENYHKEQDIFQQRQALFYQLGTEIARLEETLQQQRREKTRLNEEKQQMQLEYQKMEGQVKQSELLLKESERLTLTLQDSTAFSETTFKKAEAAAKEQQTLYNNWHQKMDAVNTAWHKTRNELQAVHLHLEHLQNQKQQILIRFEKIDDESRALLQTQDSDHLITYQKQQQELQEEYQAALSSREEQAQLSQELRNQLTKAQQALHQEQDKTHQLSTLQASLATKVQVLLGRQNDPNEIIQYAGAECLLDILQVEKEWQFACEFVLKEALQGFVFTSLEPIWTKMEHLESQSIFLTAQTPPSSKAQHPCLAEKMKGCIPNWLPNVSNIYTAETWEEAQQWLATLGEHESVITPKGQWLGKGWVKCAGKIKKEAVGLLQLQEELLQCQKELEKSKFLIEQLRQTRSHLEERIKSSDTQLSSVQQTIATLQQQLQICAAEIARINATLLQVETRKNHLALEKTELEGNLEDLLCEQEKNLPLQELKQAECSRLSQEKQQLEGEKGNLEQALQTARLDFEKSRENYHDAQLQKEREELKIQQLQKTIELETERAKSAYSRMEWIGQKLEEMELPNTQLHDSLAEKLKNHDDIKAQSNQHNAYIHEITEKMAALEISIQTEEKQCKILQEKIQQERLQEQALVLRSQGILESIAEYNEQVESLLGKISLDAHPDLRERELQDIVDKIKRLGSINLLAIEEYDNEQKRKEHLDAQCKDLQLALATLDAAIESMDKETEQRLRQTFDEVNNAFQKLFPRLFGGGRAKLELTCDNLLEAGVVVMAHPPGKRNSTIHLLSGGEKAMTAIALVFAIFQLNPSPFCMLDEVDAPLDDVNVGRFCELVKEMSESVQFLFITHNKLTMELADHLIGVTMREPGVSRIVAVDVEQALAMSEN